MAKSGIRIIIRISINIMYLAEMPNTIKNSCKNNVFGWNAKYNKNIYMSVYLPTYLPIYIAIFTNFWPFCIKFSLVISLPNHLERSRFF